MNFEGRMGGFWDRGCGESSAGTGWNDVIGEDWGWKGVSAVKRGKMWASYKTRAGVGEGEKVFFCWDRGANGNWKNLLGDEGGGPV